jgi:tetratricopeptide (TPR) repeat protein
MSISLKFLRGFSMSNGEMKPSSGITTRSYKGGSIIYFENDRSEFIYILKQGRVLLTSKKVEQGEFVETKEDIKPGEFFGVKSALGKYPRDETAQTVGDTIVLVLTLADFETLVLKNIKVVKKMLRVFSNQLRRLNRLNREILGEGGVINPETELFNIGEHYYKVGRYKQALYAYKKYMEYYPDTKFSEISMKRIEAINSGDIGSDMQTDMEIEPTITVEEEDRGETLSDFSIDEPTGDAASDDLLGSGVDELESSLSSEMDDFLSDERSDNLDDFSFDDSSSGKPAESSIDITSKYYDAVNLFSQGSYGQALSLYKEILNVKTLRDDSERNFFEKSHFEIGRCYLKLGEYNEALKALSTMIKTFPKSDHVKIALFHIGMAYEMMKNFDKAVTYYTKVSSIEPKDQINKQALKRLSIIEKSKR